MGKKHAFSFEAKVIIRYIIEYKRLLLWLSIVAFFTSLIVSYLIPEKFKSTVIIYPASYSDNKPWFDLKDNKAWFGQLYEIDHYLQIISSEEVKDKIIEKYKLGEHYGIVPTEKYYETEVNGAYYSNISFARTRYQSIRIEVLDNDPKWAANIANDIVSFSDTIMNRIYKQKAAKDVMLFETQYNAYMEFMSAVADSLNSIGKDKGIANIETQSQELTKAWSEAIKSGNIQAAKDFDKRLKELANYSGFVEKQKKIIEYNSEYFSRFMGSYINAKSQLKQDMPYSYKYVVDKAKVADKKHSPKKSIIILVSTLATFMLVLMILIFRDSFKKLMKD